MSAGSARALLLVGLAVFILANCVIVAQGTVRVMEKGVFEEEEEREREREEDEGGRNLKSVTGFGEMLYSALCSLHAVFR